jgi:hypothetical protein
MTTYFVVYGGITVAVAVITLLDFLGERQARRHSSRHKPL